MLDALTFLDMPPGAVGASPDLVDDAVELETIGGTGYGDAPRSGLSFVVGEDGRVEAVHLYADGHQGYDGYVGVIPSGIRFDMSRGQVRTVLGSPGVSLERRRFEGQGDYPAYDLFDLGGAYMHLEYAPDLGSIQLITLMKPSAVP